MTYFEKRNNVVSRLVGSVSSGATSITVSTGDGSIFPSSGVFPLTIWDDAHHPNPTADDDREIVWGTAVTGDVITVVRGKEDTSGFAHQNGARVAMLLTSGVFDDATYGVQQAIGLKAPIESPVFTGDVSVSSGFVGIGTAANSFGDSITFGAGSSSSELKYVELIGEAMGWTMNNQGAGGYELPDMIDEMYATAIVDSSISTAPAPAFTSSMAKPSSVSSIKRMCMTSRP